MSLIKLALDNTNDGFKTSRIWKSRGLGALFGAGAGVGIGSLSGSKGALIGALVGAIEGASFGDAASKITQGHEYAKRHGSKHAILQSINPLTPLRNYKNTPFKESLKQLSLERKKL